MLGPGWLDEQFRERCKAIFFLLPMPYCQHIVVIMSPKDKFVTSFIVRIYNTIQYVIFCPGLTGEEKEEGTPTVFLAKGRRFPPHWERLLFQEWLHGGRERFFCGKYPPWGTISLQQKTFSPRLSNPSLIKVT